MSWYYYFNPFDSHIEIQSSWIKLREMPWKAIVVKAQKDK